MPINALKARGIGYKSPDIRPPSLAERFGGPCVSIGQKVKDPEWKACRSKRLCGASRQITWMRLVIGSRQTRMPSHAWSTYCPRVAIACQAVRRRPSCRSAPSRAVRKTRAGFGHWRCNCTVCAPVATGATAISPISPHWSTWLPISEPPASRSIRCMRCSTTPPTPVPIRPTADCSSTRAISMSKPSLNFPGCRPKWSTRLRRCGGQMSSTMAA